MPGDENVGLYNTECVWESFPWLGRRPCKDGFSLQGPYKVKTPFTNSVDRDRSQCGNE